MCLKFAQSSEVIVCCTLEFEHNSLLSFRAIAPSDLLRHESLHIDKMVGTVHSLLIKQIC